MKISYTFNPFRLNDDLKISPDKKAEAQDLIKEFVRESILDYVGDGNSPVRGERAFPALSPKYKKLKSESSSAAIPNLELTGDMLDALEVREKNSEAIEVGVFQRDQADKADGHCNFSGKSKLPRRRFIPDDGQTFKADILNGIRDILKEFAEED